MRSFWRKCCTMGAAGLALSSSLAAAAEGKPGIPAGAFPIVAFSAGNPTDRNFAEVKALGFDYVHRYRLASHRDPAEVQTYMDTAARNGLKVMMDVSGFIHPRFRKAKTPDEGLGQLLAAVRKWKDHPALGFWYVYDEPTPKQMPVETLRRVHALIKRETPRVPTAIAQCWSAGWWKYMDCVDIIMPDFYPVRDKPFPEARLDLMPSFYGRVRAKASLCMPIVQCFGFPRLPNRAEVRYMLYAALTQGIDGMAFWSYYYGRFRPFQKKDKDGVRRPGEFDKSYMPKVYSPVLKEFKGFVAKVMPAREVAYSKHVGAHRDGENHVIHGLWPRGDATYVVLINNQPAARRLSMPWRTDPANAALAPICGTRATDAKIRDGKLTISEMQPWETFVWEQTPTGE